MNLKICPICRSLYPEDFVKCDRCNEELIDNEVYKKWNDNKRNEYMRKYKPMYKTEPSSVTVNKLSVSIQHKQDITQQQNIPKCPICQSTNLSKITTVQKVGKIALFGIFGMGDNGKTWKCNNCGSKF